MGRKHNPFSRPYKLTPEAIEQRRIAASERWARLNDPESRTLSGRPKKRRRHALRGSDGRFVKC